MRIKKMFQVAMMLSLACLFFVTSAASAKTTNLTSSPKLMNCFDVAGNVTYKTAPDGSITKIIEVQNVSEFSEQNNLRLDPDSTVTIYIPDSSDNNQPNYSSNNSVKIANKITSVRTPTLNHLLTLQSILRT